MRDSLRVLGKISAENIVLVRVGRHFSLLGGGMSFSPYPSSLPLFPPTVLPLGLISWCSKNNYFLRRWRTLCKAHFFLPELLPSTRRQALMLAAQCMAPQAANPDGLLSTLSSSTHLLSLVFCVRLCWVVVGIEWATYVQHLACVWYRVNAEIIIINNNNNNFLLIIMIFLHVTY